MLDKVREQPEAVRFLERVVGGELTCPLLLVGQEGVGRKFSVLAAAKQSFSKGDANSPHILQIDHGAHPDVTVIAPEIPGKEIGIKEVRKVIEDAYSFPSLVPSRYVIIDGADWLSTAAANAMLKTLEEPPKTTRFFLLAEQSSDVLPTIRSRCGLVRYQPLSEALIVEHLDQHTADPTKSLVCARLADGSVGRAIQYLGSGRLALRDQMTGLLEKGLGGDLSSLFSAVNEVSSLKLGLRFLEHLLRDLVMLPLDPTRLTNVDIVEKLGVLRSKIGERRLGRLVTNLANVKQHHRAPVNLAFHVKTYLADVFSE